MKWLETPLRILKYCFIILIYLFCSEILANVNEIHRFAKYSFTDGLSNDWIKSIVQDSHGYLWIGTDDGLNRFNGHEFKVYRAGINDSMSLRSNSINQVYIDSFDRLWVSSGDFLYFYDKSSDGFINFHSPTGRVNCVFEDSDKTLWVGTEYGLLSFDGARLKAHNLVLSRKENERIVGSQYFAINAIEEEGDKLILGTWTGLLVVNKYSNVFEWYRQGDSQKNIPDNRVTSLVKDGDSNIWIGTYNGLVQLDLGKNQLTEYSPFKLNSNKVLSLIILEGDLWIGTEQQGLLKMSLNANGLEVTNKYLDSESQSDLSYRSISTIYKSKEDILWVGTHGGGLNSADLSKSPFKSIVKIKGFSESLSHSKVWGITSDRNGNLWVGTDGGGLNVFNSELKRTKIFRTGNECSISDDAILSAFVDSNGKLWFGTYQGGLNAFDPNTGCFAHYLHENGKHGSIGSNDVRVIFEDSKNNLWIGTNLGGLCLYDSLNDAFKVFATNNSAIAGDDVRAIYEDGESNLWIGTYGNGLSVLKDGSFNNFYLGNRNSNSYNVAQINTIMSIKAAKGFLWLGTRAGGLIRFDPITGQYLAFDEREGLPSNIVHSIEVDGSENLWISTNKGIAFFDTDKYVFKSFGMKDLGTSIVFNECSSFKDDQGVMYFGSHNGLLYFDPEEVQMDFEIPSIHIDEIRLVDRKICNPETMASKLSIPYSERVFSLVVDAIDFNSLEKTYFSYRLREVEDKWNVIQNQNTIMYSAISPGTYTFQVMGSYDGVNWSEIHEVKFEVQRPYWLSWWAFLGYGITLFLILRWYRSLIKSRAKIQENLRVERLEQNKMQELFDIKMKFYTNVSHEIRTPLTLIIGPLEQLIGQCSQLENQNRLLDIYNNAQRLLNLVNQLLDFRKVDSGNMEVKSSELNLAEFTYEVYRSFYDYSKSKGIKLDFHSDLDELKVWFDPGHLEIIIYNLLSNAIKYTGNGGTAKIDLLKVDSRFVEISIVDNGTGIPKEYINNIFDRYYQIANSKTIGIIGSGIGLALVKDLVDLNKGEIVIESEVNVGTAIKVRLRLGSEHLTEKGLVGPKDGEDVSHYALLKEETKNSTEIVGAERNLILIVEDNSEVRKFIRNVFNDHYDILEAADGREGIELAISRLPDIVISDVLMPEVDGIELCSTLKSVIATSHIPIILLTALSNRVHKVKGISTGADSYITKPFSPDLIFTTVLSLLQNRERVKEHYVRRIILEPSNTEITSVDEDFLMRAMNCIEKRLDDETFGVKALVDEMCLSQPSLYRKIKALTGLSVSEFIRSIRLKKAAEFLRSGKYNISEVTYKVGFSDLRYFRICFVKQYSMTPSEYVRREAQRLNVD